KNAEYWIHTDSTPIKNAHPRSVTRFERAGSPEQAQGFRENGQLLVHAGVTLVRAADFLREIESDKPEIISRARMALTSGRREMDFFHPDPAILFGAPDLSLEAGLLETSANIVVIPADFGWTDAKDWAVLWDVGVKDGDGNVTVGEVIARDTRGCYLRSEGPVTVTAGIENLVVVSTDDAVLVATRDNVAQVQSLVEADMCDRATVETLGTRRIYQAWGYAQLLHGGPLFLVRRLAIKIGARLPLQRNPAQSSHLVVLNGTAMITRGTETVMIETNDSIHITQGMTFRIDNAGDVPLEIVEVLSERGEPL
ncbi:MAG: mannose-1-phosphate guanylyltransferase/mannose-6-phosphate isomerase, partial [Pseudomonadota bacterium]|nr:mannose-1-phosphate guanylyltransferase/mannose-6-phosphate isomerase [Pseudomonadota bacterium]